MKRAWCTNPDCTFPQGGRCAREAEFEDPLTCTSLRFVQAEPPTQASTPVQPTAPVAVDATADEVAPWRGRHLNVQEAEDILRRSPARIISVLGPYNAGKTSLMASFFLQLANAHYGTFPYRVASSRTLYGFQDLVDRANRWTGKPGEQIVDHTPAEDSMDAGRFLHLGLRPANEKDDRHLDILLSDVAGEWIESWTRRADAEAKRRLAFIPRSDGFIIVADAAELMGDGGMEADAAIGRLIRRVVSAASHGRGRGLALVFSKFDRIVHQEGVEMPDEASSLERAAWGELGALTESIWGALKQAKEAGFAVRVLALSAFPIALKEGQPVGVMAPFTHIMEHADRRERWPLLHVPVPTDADPFQAMRRWRAEP